MRTIINLNENWLFHRGDIKTEIPAYKGPVFSQSKTERKRQGPYSRFYPDFYDDFGGVNRVITHEKCEKVNLPHDFVDDHDLFESENNAFGYLHYDNAWYRKHFRMPDGSENKRVLLRFDGIAGVSTIYVNGCLMYHNYSAYNTFEFDITEYVLYDEDNVISVYVNREEWEGWWYQGGGIYRNVYLTITEPIAIDLWGVYAPYEKINETDWKVNFETTVINSDYYDADVRVESYLYDKNGTEVARAHGEGNIALRDKGVIKYSTIVNKPLLWDCDNPNLYNIKTMLFLNDESIDENITRIGFRTVEISVDKGLLLNGKKTVIKGVCAHQDFGLTGLAVSDNIARYKITLIKEMGANGYRTSHYQQTEAYMEALDEMGFLVMDEARWFESSKEAFEQLESLIKRDRNRPSVIMWSTSNEEPNHVRANGKKLHKAISAHIRKFDYTRPITVAQDRTPENSTVFQLCDFIGINYNLNTYDEIHKMSPDKPIFASECCATGTTRDWHFDSDVNGRIRDKDAETNGWYLAREKTWQFLMERPYVFGGYQWAAVEHRGEAIWPAICSKSGALDLFLFKKGAFYQNKSHWSDKPMVHIVPHWNFEGLEGKEIIVIVYTNCDCLELFLNNKSLGKKQIEKYGHGEWKVPYEKGEICVKGYKDGKLVCEDKRVTTNKAVALILKQDVNFEANGKDIALFTCECIDENLNVVPNADPFVKFSVNSPAKIIGTGSDNCDHNRVGLSERQMYMGKIRIAVKPQKGQKEIILTAQSSGLKIGQINVKL